MKPLKRRWAQVSMVMWYLGWGLFFLVGLVFCEWLEADFQLPAFEIGMSGIGLMALSFVPWYLTARCPHCGKRGGPRTWVYRKSYCCRCGHVLPFDDGPAQEEAPPLSQRTRMTVKRGWARLTLALAAAGSACLVAFFRIMDYAPQSLEDYPELQARQDIGAPLLLVGLLLLLGMGWAADFRLVCPRCRKGHVLPWQRRERWCWGCGAALAFQGELEPSAEERP